MTTNYINPANLDHSIYKPGGWRRMLDWESGQTYYENGTWNDGKKDGPWVGYNKDGTVNKKYTGTYKDGVKIK